MFKRVTFSKLTLIAALSAGLLSGCLTTKDVSLAVRAANAEIQSAAFADPSALTNLPVDADSKEVESAETQLLKSIQTLEEIGKQQSTPSINNKAAVAALKLRLTILYIVTDRYNLAEVTAKSIEQGDLSSQTQRTFAGITNEYAAWRKVTKSGTDFRVCGPGESDVNSSSCLDWEHYPKKLNDAQNVLVNTTDGAAPVLLSPENSDIHAFLSVWKGRVGAQFVSQRSNQVISPAQVNSASMRLASVVAAVTPYLTKTQSQDLEDLCNGVGQTIPVVKRTLQLKNMMNDFDNMIETKLVTPSLSEEAKDELLRHQFKHANSDWFKGCKNL
ncbi:hypothetical protein [Alteromonas sp. 009811495]|uniref:hypothetical protein n=1 Tax=Alteromonas sp. 009811495 TaxID=3002962 RepID=UPI00237DB92E|nr:hypothetical protein [Alteromonas sp. 009811495]WDT85120.1 hypothetical protein OZ660_14405 [Alteromonas sp. 009811495]